MRSTRNRSPAIIPPPYMAALPESDYAFTLTRIAVAQICNSIGFTTAEAPALRTLTDIATRYLRSIAKSAAESANSTGRTQSNLVDTVSAVDELSSFTGFPGGAWKVSGSLLNSSEAVKELVRFSKYSEEIPFAKPLPRRIFGRGKGLRHVVVVGGGGGNEYVGSEWKHIPKWLPVVPVLEEEEKENGGRKGNETMWGFCGEIIEREMNGEEENSVKRFKRERKGIKLPLKRGKVRFKIGNGEEVLAMCKRGGGIGKRVLCES